MALTPVHRLALRFNNPELSTVLVDSCAIQTLVGATTDSAGGTTGGTWTTQVTVDCRVSSFASRGSGTGREATIADGLAELVDVVVTVPHGTAITAPQRVVHTDGQTATATTYEVVAVSKPNGLEYVREAYARIKT